MNEQENSYQIQHLIFSPLFQKSQDLIAFLTINYEIIALNPALLDWIQTKNRSIKNFFELSNQLKWKIYLSETEIRDYFLKNSELLFQMDLSFFGENQVTFNATLSKEKDSSSVDYFMFVASKKLDTENFLEKIIDSMPGSVYWKNQEGVYLGCNKYMLEKSGFHLKSNIVGKKDCDLWPEYADQLRQNDTFVMKSGKQIALEEQVVVADGRVCSFEVQKMPLKDSKGNVSGVIGVSIDITERKRLEQELQESHVREERLKMISAVGNMIAAEMITPLRSIQSGAEGIRSYLPALMKTYETAKIQGLSVPYIHPMHYEALKDASETIGLEVTQAFNVTDMLLMQAKQDKINPNRFKLYSMASCIQQALERYPLTGDERKIIHVDVSSDFEFKGQELFMIHVVLNLLKNALHYIKSGNKGEIYITTNSQIHELHFKDTGPGILAEHLPLIFDPFFTSGNAHGTGLGLAFCKMVMESFGGSIHCNSVEGEFTEFVLQFPT